MKFQCPTLKDIEEAFPLDAPYVKQLDGCQPEIIQIDRDFRGKSWKEISPKLCLRHNDAFSMMDEEPLGYFLPSFLRACIDPETKFVAEMLVYWVGSSRFDVFARRLNAEQLDLVFGIALSEMGADGYDFNPYDKCSIRDLVVEAIRKWKVHQ